MFINTIQKLLSIGRQTESFLGDLLMNVKTRGSVYFDEKRGKNRDAFDFDTVAHSAIEKTIRLVNPTPEDVAIVLGCGKGRAVCHFARQRINKVIGIEISEQLSKIAKENASTLRKKQAAIEIQYADVSVVDISEGTIFFLFNPFGEKTLRHVLKSIEISRNDRIQPVRIIYMNAKLSYVFNEFPWLKIDYCYQRLKGQRVIIYRELIESPS